MDADDVAIGRRLKAARTAAGMKTRKELTDAAGIYRVGEKVLGMIERGERHLQPHEAEAFAQALNIDARSFYDDPQGTQLDRIEQILTERHQQDRIIDAMLKEQTEILREIRRVMAGLPNDDTLRLLNEATQQAEAALAAREARAAKSSGTAGTRRRAGEG